jgi:hypothetical protein
VSYIPNVEILIADIHSNTHIIFALFLAPDYPTFSLISSETGELSKLGLTCV